MITVNIIKARETAHEARRVKRGKELAPLDIEATIPDIATEAEKSRKGIRKKYADLQVDIDNADVDSLYIIMESLK